MVNILKKLFAGDPTLRPAHYAGRLYPSDPDELKRVVADCFGAIEGGGDAAARAVIVPHSDPRLVGRLVATGLARLQRDRRVVIMGPSRRVPFGGVAATASEGWDSPLGWLKVEREAYAPIADLPVARQLEEAHAAEACIELQVPFLKHARPDDPILPVLVGDIGVGELATVIARLWTPDAVLVVASEFSEGTPRSEAVPYDSQTLELIEAGDVDGLDGRILSGRRIVQAMLEVAGERGLSASAVATTNSADEGGPDDITVGYGAVVVS